MGARVPEVDVNILPFLQDAALGFLTNALRLQLAFQRLLLPHLLPPHL